MAIVIILIAYVVMELLAAFLKWMFETPVHGKKKEPEQHRYKF